MSTQQRRGIAADGISEEAVAHYLNSHPEFFERHGQLLAKLRLPHQTHGSAISLVERQVDILRQRNRKLERKLRDLVDVARCNDSLVGRIHGLALQLIGTRDLVAVLAVVEQTLRQDFGASHAVLLLFSTCTDLGAVSESRFLRKVDRDADEIKAFETFLAKSSPRCGQIRDSQRDFLFGAESDEIGSVAMVPLGESPILGVLAIGSSDRERFHAGMSTDFLARIGDLVTGGLRAR